jgi:hypothetical protein
MTQLSLIDTPRTWRLDERTRATGRAGIARARAALAAGIEDRRERPDDRNTDEAAARRRAPRRRPGRRPTPTGAPDRRRAAA